MSEDIEHTGRAGEIQREIDERQRELDAAKGRLSALGRSCKHAWGSVVYAPIERKGYSYAGDPVGTMGVDWRPGGYVPAETVPRWTQTCKECGWVQSTTATHKEKRVLEGGIHAEVDAPAFPVIH